ncbi:MAG: AI-2E family transporter [Dermatophilaceae bacterium]
MSFESASARALVITVRWHRRLPSPIRFRRPDRPRSPTHLPSALDWRADLGSSRHTGSGRRWEPSTPSSRSSWSRHSSPSRSIPVVERLLHAGLSRAGAVTVVFAVVLVIFTLLGLLVVPPVVTQSTELAESSPQILRDLMNHPWIRDVDTTYHVLDKASQEINKRLADGAFMSQLFGGVLGAGMALLSGIVSVFTVLVLTLYFLVSLPTIKSAAYAMVPAGRRPRVVVLSEEIMRRVGSYAIGQLTVATINACCSYVMMKIVGIPYAAVLAVMVGFLGLIPMIGATLGAILVAAVALFVDPTKALVALVYFLIYQQLENYVISPKIMQRTVSVPGAVTIVAAMIGGALAGVLGALLAIPTAAGLLLLYEEVLVPRQAAR